MSENTFGSYAEPHKTPEYTLFIRISKDGFSFLTVTVPEKRQGVYDATHLKISNETFIARHFDEWVKSDKRLQQEFKKVNIIFDTANYTIVPEDYYDCDLKPQITNLLFETTEETETEDVKLAALNARLLFCIPSELKHVIELHFKNVELSHPVKTLIENLAGSDKKFRLILYFNKYCFYALLFNEGNLLLSNSFTILHENDPVFYVLLLLKQMKVARHAVDLFIAGNVSTSSNLCHDLQKYIPQVHVLKHRKTLQTDEDVYGNSIIDGFSLLLR
jgi:hypothetical protein